MRGRDDGVGDPHDDCVLDRIEFQDSATLRWSGDNDEFLNAITGLMSWSG